jgi:GT2 family glycosyltransferase
MKSPVDVIIPSYNGKYLLEKNLSSVVSNTENLGTIIVVDNGSTDDTVSWLNKNFPKVIVLQNKSNLGYTIPVNQGVEASKSELFILINNDVRPKKGYLGSALKYFDDPSLFAVTFNEENSSWPNLSWSGGKMQFSRGQDKTRPYYSAWASGGSAIFRRSVWKELGGLDEIYAPWYWEDIDIGYRAWKSGFKIIWEPRALVVHDHESTSKKLDPKYVNLIKQRNELLFNWLNVRDVSFKTSHLSFLITHSLRHPGYLKVILSAIYRLITHSHIVRAFVVSDQEVQNYFSKPYEN